VKTPPAPVLFEVVRPERNPVFVGWCHLCGLAIYPSPTNWYCRSCAQKVRGEQH